jgi:hypothetical protein
LKVLDEVFADHTIEIEESKSYPGLLTMYHLYTVDIICSGLPTVDFNTLEFDHGDASGHRKLKYIHAWVWLEWSKIQRYLFEGSELRERKAKGSFQDSEALRLWLAQFSALDLDLWGQKGCRSVNDLFNEVEREETHLELWGRKDGVPLLMRVVHVLQMVVCAVDKPQLSGKHLLQIWQSSPEGQVRTVHRLLAKKLSTRLLPFDEARFGQAAREAVKEQLQICADSVAIASLKRCKSKDDALSKTAYKVTIGDQVSFLDQRYDIEDSPTYTGMHTMYHLYTVQVDCQGLPEKDFSTLDFDRAKAAGKDRPHCLGWRWVSWMQAVDLVHAQVAGLQRKETLRLKKVSQSLNNIRKLRAVLDNGSKNEETSRLLTALYDDLADMQAQSTDNDDITAMLPPTMVSQMTESARVSRKLDHQTSNPALSSSQSNSWQQASSAGRSPYGAITTIVHEEIAGPANLGGVLPARSREGERCRPWGWSPWCGCTTDPPREDELQTDKRSEGIGLQA